MNLALSKRRSPVTVRNGLLQYGELKIPLVSGEFHYWRVLRENWSTIADRIKEMGLEVVATYIPWNYHELSPGKYDFTGKTSPQRDLAGFLDLMKEKELFVIVRPGPYIYAEWPCGGPPERATRHDRLSPEFLAMARDYLAHVSEVLVPRQITRSGSIILCQADNEPYPPVESFGEEIGCFQKPGIFKEWLEAKYQGDITRLNQLWQTNFTSFQEACFYFHEPYVDTSRPLADRLLPERRYHQRYADCFEFIGWYAAKIVETVAGWLRESGIEVPISANSWSPLYADFSRFCEVADLAGTDIYPGAFLKGDYPTGDNWLYNLDILKMSEANVTEGNVWSAEFQSGIYPLREVGYLPPKHFWFVPAALMARGLKGWNWYMLVNRDNWYHCPINEWGRTNEYFPFHRQAVSAYREIEPWNCQPLYDVSLLVYKPHRVIAPGNFTRVFQTLEQADLSYAYFDPRCDFPPACQVMVYSGSDWLEKKCADRLAEFVTSGGTLITFSRYPRSDESEQPISGLPFLEPEGARPTNLPVSIIYGQESFLLTRGGHCDCKVNFVYFRKVPGKPLVVRLTTQAKETLVDIGAARPKEFVAGYSQPVGKGRVIYLGTNPSPDILRMVLKEEGLSPYVFCQRPLVTTDLHRHRQGHLVLFVINRNEQAVTVECCLNLKRL
ncbi:MAG TPA: beta-galactosidase, partial [bacterium]|nr:beta-galactosidase [bacterium]